MDDQSVCQTHFDKKLISLFEITLIIISGFAFAHSIAETNVLIESLPVESHESKFISFLREKILNSLSKGLVSAQSSLQTCLLDNDGSYCQEYPASVCASECTAACFPGRRTDFSACQLGTCYDSNQGLCNGGTPRALCENSGGQWSAQIPAQCNRECCLIAPDGSGGASQAQFATQQQCNYLGQSLGAPVSWVPVAGELECLLKVASQKDGACVLDLDIELNKYNCETTTGVSCLTQGGDFYEGQLCTNPALNTKCERTGNTQCFNDKDGVYFIDSCENKANVYDSTKLNDAPYWNSIVPVSQSCALGTSSSFLSNQQRCGNCDYLQGSICGTPQPSVDKTPISGQYVCKDLSCIDEEGNKRLHGSSWCAFDGRIGLDGANGTNQERSVDLPGSRHYKKSCFNGEIRLEECAEFRNGLCVESDAGNNGFTSAQCRMNTGLLCLKQNGDPDKLAKCEENPDCFAKHVGLDKLQFDICVPKYPLGFELQDQPEPDSEMLCAYATNTCTFYEKKNIEGRWTCKINCECKEAVYAETMNNLCMSLGDCGGKVNLEGEFSKNYITSGDRTPVLSQDYIDDLRQYTTPLSGQRVDNLDASQLAALLGLDEFAFEADNIGSTLSTFGLGAAGALAYSSGVAIATPSYFTVTGWGGVANGALIGAGIGYIIGMVFGLEGDELMTAVIVGAVVVVALGYAGLWTAVFGAANVPVVGWIVAIIIIVVIVILEIAGVGDYREKKVTFSCLPWQPPTGGDNCEKCGDNGLGCTEYKCKSLGKTCGFLNKGSDNELCVNIAPNDVSAPVIEINPSAFSSGFSSENAQSGLGVRIKNASSSDGCLKEYSPVTFGIKFDEAGQCKFATGNTQDYESMDEFFENNFYAFNHTDTFAMPTLDSLGVGGVDPARRGNYDLYIRCQDGSGNSNSQEYVARFCVAPANDVQPPQITKFIPESPGVVGINSESFNLQFYTNEPATCRSSSQDIAYENMEMEANCHNEINQATLNGWLCLAQLNVTSATNNYYLRCADQPWLGMSVTSSSTATIDPSRNVMGQSQNYIVQKTTTALSITSATLNGTMIYTSTQPVSATLDIVTAGGIDNGKAFCKYSFDTVNYVDFFETSLSTHRQTFSSLFANNYDIGLQCTDRAGNTASSSVQFNIVLDNTGPLITRVYSSGNSLQVVTNEPSSCAYSTSSCSFDFGEGVLLSGAGNSHTMPYINGITYRIKCQDTFANTGTCLSVSGGY